VEARSVPGSASSRPGQIALPVFEEIFDEYGPFVWRVLGRLGVWPPDVPDVCQEVFVVVYRRLDDYDGRASLRSWLYGICARVAADHRRRRASRRERVEDPLPEPAIAPHQEGDVEARRAEAFLHTTLAALDEEKRAVFVLYELEEFSMTEVVAALGCPLQTAYSRLYAARRSVTQAFRRLELGSAR
jgi:RNA polymerase sigma-70 factor (ECF subfamily)